MATPLNWREVKVLAKGGPVVVQLTGNADTEVATRYFWLRDLQDTAEQTWDKKDGEPLAIEPVAISGKLNRLGFVFNAAPLVSTERNLVVSVRVLQGSGQPLVLEDYFLEREAGADYSQYGDGITLVVR